ncbi:hypothetical protein BDZ89DRAFT_1154452 [Hymenopellis radicata]|nr:hypothetical protein BDZ89DRAFT_1154452 [Hymenopellis radicata]
MFNLPPLPAPPTMVTYIVDDQDTDITFLCPTVPKNEPNSYFQDTWSTIGNDTVCNDGWFKYTFRGQGVNINSGLSGGATKSYSVSLDGDALQPQTGEGGYDSGMLADEEHTVMYATGAMSYSPNFDYLTVLAGNTTKMRGRSVIVDDNDGVIKYSGAGWVSASIINSVEAFPYGRGPYRDSVHWTKEVGESLSFEFLGSSVALYSVLPAQKDGGITIQYFIDDNFVTAAGVSNTGNTPVPMFKLFEADGLSDGTHVLMANITSVISSYSIGMDFVTYTSSFDNISEMPTTGLSSSSSGSTGSGSGTHKRNHVGAIVGGVLGGLAFIGIVMLALYVLRARKRQQQRSRAAATVIGRNFNSQLDVKVVPRPESHPMSPRQV